jgi:5-methylcytosine-specific restriction endonuclease McrA
MSTDVLVLNRNFYPVAVTSWQRALSLLVVDRAWVVDDEYRTYGLQDWIDLSREMSEHPAGFVHTPNLSIAIPEVVALRLFDRVPVQQVPFTRRNIYFHYGYRCCYCGKQLPSDELNLDHVVPRSRGGGTDWSNIVTACIPCNLKKGAKLPQEAGMKLLIQPTKPKGRARINLALRLPVPVRRSWQRFIDTLYWNSELQG